MVQGWVWFLLLADAEAGPNETPSSTTTETVEKLDEVPSDRIEAMPKPVHVVPADYPAKAKRKHIEGWAKVRVRIDADGNVLDARVVSAQPEDIFDKAAVRAAKQWRFSPPGVDGKSSGSIFEFKMMFKLKD